MILLQVDFQDDFCCTIELPRKSELIRKILGLYVLNLIELSIVKNPSIV